VTVSSAPLHEVVVVQVCTRRIQVTSSLSAYGASIRHPTATTLFAKRLVQQMLSQSYGAPSDSELLARRIRCGAAAQGLSRAFGQLQRSKSRGFLGLFGGRDTYTMPPQLLPLAESLYHLQRGSMLGTVVGHVDERVHLYQLFLQSDALLSTAMVMPLAFQVRVSLGGTVSVCGGLHHPSVLLAIIPPHFFA
jgi:hypothetical protein